MVSWFYLLHLINDYIWILDAVVIVIHRLMVALQGTAVVGIVEILCGIAAFFFVSFGGFAIGMFYGVITSLVTLSTSGVRGKKWIIWINQ